MESNLDFIKTTSKLKLLLNKKYDKEVAEALGLNQLTYATIKKRGSIPFLKIIELAKKNNFDLNFIFKDEDE